MRGWRALLLVVWLAAGCATPPRPALPVDPHEVSAFRELTTALTAPEMAGRGLGSPGIAIARDLLAERLAEMGLQPAFADGYIQRRTVPRMSLGREDVVENVGAMLPGRGDLGREVVLVGAHYDHLGAVTGEDGRPAVYPGADDNASGVAVMLLIAGSLRDRLRATNHRTLVFVAFSGEEEGMLGSRELVRDPTDLRIALPQIAAMLNLDMVGRLGDGPLQIRGVQSSPAWPRLLRGVADDVGLPVRLVDRAPPRSDHLPFRERGIPVLLLHTGLHADYHRPTDTPEKLDASGAVRIARFVADLIEQLATAPSPEAGL